MKQENRQICLPFDEENYDDIVKDPLQYRLFIDEMIIRYPELFPPNIMNGYKMKDEYYSKKLGITTRRITTKNPEISYTVRPSFVMPYMTGKTDDVEKMLFLRKFAVPFWALTYIFGRNQMYWYRIEQSIGRNSIVGTTVKDPENLPKNLSADEKHTKLKGEKVYVATTVGEDCILGASIAPDAGEVSLMKSYGVFKEEAQNICADYEANTYNTDGWAATRKALKTLFPFATFIQCFLHIYIGIRDRTKKKFRDIFHQVSDKLWNCYDATNKSSFVQRVRRLHEWAKKNDEVPLIIEEKIKKLHTNIDDFKNAYDHPGAHRTSNMLDRLMQRMDRHLFSTQYFHGSMDSAELGIRSWALITNFAPSNPYTVKKYEGLQSPAERLNQFCYHENWLHNLMISASMGGFRNPPLNPL